MIRFFILFRQNRNLVIYLDADYASDKSNQKSIIITIKLLGGGLVYYASKNFFLVLIIITKIKYIIISFTTKTS
jgi:hypothetical protein